ncbi:DNA gyrase subunit A [Metamycoplasma arthritidis]|uniref:DNA topoisomerase (ATP-hydrolyzing) n=1 Tax=Metamycoplasma arthritidis (strain 158L3-1) TaxID=243272 RepID=B3PLT5_META1|nr:DNA topoisomerase (ATP-hydrolyzing) [Metamycoplasma arthritidis]ACF06987.1 topoiosmerase IV subunit A [Metamycoplasma arthritidis 158L3-1]VEU78516.1 DNA gyrase subunit A [Metamycoplasma arthritidis]
MTKKQKEEMYNLTETIIEKNMVDVMSERFGRYSKYIIQQRAIPDARDGLKPVQRRILYSMYGLKLYNNQAFRKSAKIVGEVMGRYHPHGDSSIYEALVRMSQEWKSNFPLIEMHGNKGSIDDDPAAAMRYTESRLEKISELILKDLDRKVVAMAPNFDDTEYEPVVLPSLIPNLLINGSKGIAAGFATEIPPHNLSEVIDATIKLIKNPLISLEELKQIVQGPDFPTGGVIHGIEGIAQAFETGQGKINISSRYRFVYAENKPSKIIGIEIYETPFGVIKSKLVADIDFLVIDKTINGVKEVRDQSNREGISIYLELEDEANAEAIINYLMSKTDLRISYNYNMVAIHENSPKLMNLQMLLFTYLSHLKDINTKGIEFDLKKYEIRLEIVQGFIKVSEISDEVIRVIKNSDNSKKGVIEALEKTFGFTNIQATAIAELRLYKLSKMDQLEFQNEAKELAIKIARCKELLENPNEFDKFIIEQLKDIKKEYAKPRFSEISQDKIRTEINTKLLAKNEDFYFFLSKEGYIKRISKKAFSSNGFSGFKLKDNDAIFYYDKINSLSKLIFFTNLGNYFIIDAHTLKENGWKDIGNHISSLVALENNERIIRVMEIESFNTYSRFIILTKKGMAKKVEIQEFDSKQIARKRSCIPLRPNDELCDVRIVNKEKLLFILLTGGLYYLIDENVVPEYSLKASGISLIKTDRDQEIEAFSPISPKNKVIIMTDKGQFKRTKMETVKLVGRSSHGKVFYYPMKTVSSKVISLEVATTQLQCYFTNKENEPTKFDLKNIPLSKQQDLLSNTRIKEANNIGTLIQPIKIRELVDVTSQKREALRSIEVDDDLTRSVETTIFKREYKYDDDRYEDQDLKISLLEDTLESNVTKDFEIDDDAIDVDLTLSDSSALDIDKLFAKDKNKPDPKPVSKASVDEKITAMEKIDIDTLFKKVKDIKKK